MLFKKSIFYPLEPSKTFRFGDGTRAALVDMSCARVGSRQNGVARWTTSRVVRVAPQRRSVAQDAPATAHNWRHYHETAANNRRYKCIIQYYIIYIMCVIYVLSSARVGLANEVGVWNEMIPYSYYIIGA